MKLHFTTMVNQMGISAIIFPLLCRWICRVTCCMTTQPSLAPGIFTWKVPDRINCKRKKRKPVMINKFINWLKYIVQAWQNHESFKTFIKFPVNQQTLIIIIWRLKCACISKLRKRFWITICLWTVCNNKTFRLCKNCDFI